MKAVSNLWLRMRAWEFSLASAISHPFTFRAGTPDAAALWYLMQVQNLFNDGVQSSSRLSVVNNLQTLSQCDRLSFFCTSHLTFRTSAVVSHCYCDMSVHVHLRIYLNCMPVGIPSCYNLKEARHYYRQYRYNDFGPVTFCFINTKIIVTFAFYFLRFIFGILTM